MFKFIIAAITTLFFLSACAGAVPWNPQNNAGITNISFKWCKVKAEKEGEKVENMVPCNVQIYDGKEQGSVELIFKMPDKTILNYTADTVKAFPGQEIRGDIEKSISSDVAGVIEKSIDTAGDLVGGGIGDVLDDDEDDG